MATAGERCGEQAVAELKAYRETFELDEDWLGILVEPWFDEEQGAPQV